MTVLKTPDVLKKENLATLARVESEVASFDEAMKHFQGEFQTLVIDDESLDDALLVFDLVLQLRLDTQDVLAQLLKADASLWQILGISPTGSGAINIERLKFALGSEDYRYTLMRLNQLMQSLKRLIHRKRLSEKSIVEVKFKHKKTKFGVKLEKTATHLAHARQYVGALKFSLKQLTEQLEAIEGSPNLEIFYDHINALQGPVSRFHQAMLNGLGLTENIYESLNLKKVVDNSLTPMLKNTQTLLSAAMIKEPRLFVAPNISLENLEERAERKRLGHFFGYTEPRP